MPPAFTGRLSTRCGYGPSSGNCFPVTMPGPQPDVPARASHGPPLSDLAGGTVLDALNGVKRLQPRLVFSIPYSAAGGALVTPAGNCTPLMKGTVRDDSGVMLCLKNAAVRAAPTARS